jgi:hypothetical protein
MGSIAEQNKLSRTVHCDDRGVLWVDFFMFPRLKSIMKGACFADVAAIQERVTAVLWSIPKEAFADSFRSFMNVANSVL